MDIRRMRKDEESRGESGMPGRAQKQGGRKGGGNVYIH